MDNNSNSGSKPKRLRLNPTRRWSIQEESNLIRFLLENREFEKPTAQSYYRRFMEQCSMSNDWHLVRSKVKNMRTSYIKCKALESAAEADSMDSESIKGELQRICRWYEELDIIFGNKANASTAITDIEDSLECIEDDNMESAEAVIINGHIPGYAQNDSYARTLMADIMQLQTKTLDMKTTKMVQDYSKEKELQLKERELDLKARELDLKEKELELRSRAIIIQEKQQTAASTAMQEQALDRHMTSQPAAANDAPNTTFGEAAFNAERVVKQEIVDDAQPNSANSVKDGFYNMLGYFIKDVPEQRQSSIRLQILQFASELCSKSNQNGDAL